MKKNIVFLFGLIFSLIMISCATTPSRYVVDVDSIGYAEKAPYYIYPGQGDESDLNFQEYLHYIKNAFKLNEMEVCDSIEDAKTIVFLFYSISDPKTNIASYSIPTFGQTGISSSTTYGSVYGNTFNATTTYTPTYGITGSTTHTETYQTYIRNIALLAYDKSSIEINKPIQLWKTEIQSEGSINDLRTVFPGLIAASYKYIGKNTQKKITTEILIDSPEIDIIKQ